MPENAPIYEKYVIRRTDGQHRPGKKHAECRYFVLDLDHDPAAIPALRRYILECVGDRPDLALSLNDLLADLGHGGMHTDDFLAHTKGRPDTDGR